MKSRKQIIEALEDAQTAVEEYKMSDTVCNDEYIYQGWAEALIFVLGGENERKLRDEKQNTRAHIISKSKNRKNTPVEGMDQRDRSSSRTRRGGRKAGSK